MSGRGRPSTYSDELALEICRRLGDGEGLVSICTDDGMPSRETVYAWLRDKPQFSDMYAHARLVQADHYAERIVTEAFTADDAQIGRLRMDALKWAASKLAPKRYGDKVQQELSGPDGGPMQQVIRWANDTAEATPDPSKRS